MVGQDPPRPPRVVAGVLGDKTLPEYFIGTLVVRLQRTWEDRNSLMLGRRLGRGLYAFLGQIATNDEPVPWFGQLALLAVYRDGEVHLLHYFFSVLVGVYSTYKQILVFDTKLLASVTPLVFDILLEVFVVRRSFHAVPREDHWIHLGGSAPHSTGSRCHASGRGRQ